MAAVTLLGTQVFDTNSGTKTVTATPAVGDLIVIVTAHTGNTSTTAPTDNNSDGLGTYTVAETAVKASSADTLKLWIRNARIGSATSTVFTHAPGTSSGGGLGVLKVTGMFRAGAAAELKSGKQDNQASATPAVSWTGGGSGLTGNPKIGVVFNATSAATMTKPTSFDTERFDVGYSVPTTGIEVVSDDSGNTDSTVTWGSASASAYCAAILELDTTAAPNTASLGPDNAQQYADSLAGGRYGPISWADSANAVKQDLGAGELVVNISDNLAAYADLAAGFYVESAQPTTDSLAGYADTVGGGRYSLGWQDGLAADRQAAVGGQLTVDLTDNLEAYVDIFSSGLACLVQPGADTLSNWADAAQNQQSLRVAPAADSMAQADLLASLASIAAVLPADSMALGDQLALASGLLVQPATDLMVQADSLAGFENQRAEVSDNLAGYNDTLGTGGVAQKTAALGPDNLANYLDSLAGALTLAVQPTTDNLNGWADQVQVIYALAYPLIADSLNNWTDTEQNREDLRVAPASDAMVQADALASTAMLSVAPAADSMTQADQVFINAGLVVQPTADAMTQADTLAGFEALRIQISDSLAGYADTVVASTGAQKFAALGPDNFANYVDAVSGGRYRSGWTDSLGADRQIAGAQLLANVTDSALFIADVSVLRMALLAGYVLWLVDESNNLIVDENGIGFATSGLADSLFNYADQAAIDRQTVAVTPITRSFTDNLAAYTDQINGAEALRVQPAADAMLQADVLAVAAGGLLSVSLTDGLTFTDSLGAFYAKGLNLADGMAQVDAVQLEMARAVSLSDSMTQADAVALRADLRAQPTADSLINYLDQVLAAGSGQLVVSFIESLAYADALAGRETYGATSGLSDSLFNYADQILATISISRSFTDNLAAYTDQTNLAETLRIQIVDAMALADALAGFEALSAQLSDNVAEYADTVVTFNGRLDIVLALIDSALFLADFSLIALNDRCLDGESLRRRAPSLADYFMDPDSLRRRAPSLADYFVCGDK